MAGGSSEHVPVLAEVAIDLLAVRPEGIYVDCTAGAGGHAALIARRLQRGRLVALDRDPRAVEVAAARLEPYGCAAVYHANYGMLAEVLAELRIEQVDGVLIDAGASSMQLDDAKRGFSFQADGPIDMRMDTSSGGAGGEMTMRASEYLAKISAPALARDLKRYGDVRPAKRIAKAIVARRDTGRLEGTQDLAAAVSEALDFVRGVPEEIRTVFQAIRVAVNDELRWLEAGLRAAVAALRPGGRLVVITFQSGEHRIAKRVLREAARAQRLLHPDGRDRAILGPRVRILTRKPVLPSAEEIRKNRRAQSARLRAAERLADEHG